MDATTKEDVAEALQDVLQRLKDNKPVAIFATVAVPEEAGSHRVRFLLFQQGHPSVGAAVAVAVGQNAQKVFGEFDKWMRAAGFAPGAAPKDKRR